MRAPSLDERVRERFLDEAKTLATLRHPNLVHVYDAGEDEFGVPFVVMDLLTGRTLEQALEDDGVMDAQQVLSLCLPLLGALAVAHEAGVLHRDIKPSNVFLQRQVDGSERPVLLDFGIAKRLEGPGHTTTGNVLGTPLYMAPEQATGHGLGTRTDVWSMGILMFRCLSGTVPFDAPTAVGVLMKIVYETPPGVKEVNPQIPSTIARCVDRSITREATRYDDVLTFARALASAAVIDGIELPAAPDPVGLTAWTEWVTAAQNDETGAFARVEIDSSPESHHSGKRVGDWITSSNPAVTRSGTHRFLPGRRAYDRSHAPPPRSGTRRAPFIVGSLLVISVVVLGAIWLRDPAPSPRPTTQDRGAEGARGPASVAEVTRGQDSRALATSLDAISSKPDVARLDAGADAHLSTEESANVTSSPQDGSRRSAVTGRTRRRALSVSVAPGSMAPASMVREPAAPSLDDTNNKSRRPHIVTSWDL